MKSYIVNYTETFTGQIEVKAASENEAMQIVKDKLDNKELKPTQSYDVRDTTVDFAYEV